MAEIEDDDKSTETEDEKEYDKHKLAKMLLTTALAFLVGKAVETGYDSVRKARQKTDEDAETDPTE